MMRTLFVLASGLKVLFPISPTAPIERRNSGGRKRFTESATSSNGSSISSSSSVALLHVTTSLGLPSSLSSSSPQCEFGSDQLSPRPSVPCYDLLRDNRGSGWRWQLGFEAVRSEDMTYLDF